MLEHGFEPEFPPPVQQQLQELNAHPPQVPQSPAIRDLRNLLWSSIDNDTSRDLDQIEVAERLPNGDEVLMGIADVDAFVAKALPLIPCGERNDNGLYRRQNFPMLPEQLSTGLQVASGS